MFKGNNTLTLNEATLIEAVSEYMAKRSAVGFAPVVKSVKHCTDNRGYTGQLFTVEISAAADNAAVVSTPNFEEAVCVAPPWTPPLSRKNS